MNNSFQQARNIEDVRDECESDGLQRGGELVIALAKVLEQYIVPCGWCKSGWALRDTQGEAARRGSSWTCTCREIAPQTAFRGAMRLAFCDKRKHGDRAAALEAEAGK